MPVTTGWTYLAVIIDLFRRKIVGWALHDCIDTRLCLRALARAFATRGRSPGLIHHSDRGSQYTCQAYQAEHKMQGAIPSMSRKGDGWDNAVAESFFGTLKQELALDAPRMCVDAADKALSTYIEDFYNLRRLHSTDGYRAPIDHERDFKDTAADPAT